MVFFFSFLMNFTEGGRRIIRLESAGKVSGECEGFSSAAAVYRHLFFAGLKAIPPRFSSVSRWIDFAATTEDFGPEGNANRFYGVSRAIDDIPYEWNAVRFVDRIWRILIEAE